MTSKKIALITGIGGQDGSFLAEFLLSKGYVVHGLLRHSSLNNKQRIQHLEIHPDLFLHYGDVTRSICRLVVKVKPNEIYNLAAQSFVKASFDMPQYTTDTNASAVLDILEVIRTIDPTIRFYQASTSEMFGNSPAPQSETTPFEPQSPYAISKLFAYWTVVNYRRSYGLFAVNGILFNHESPRRGDCFVSKKICRAVADINFGNRDHIELGNINAKRDWGHARDYVQCMWKMLQHDSPDDFVISTGVSRSVREFVEKAFERIDMCISWKGSGYDEVGIDQNGIVRVKINPHYFRPTEVHHLLGDCSKAKRLLGWEASTTFEDMIDEMMSVELLLEE
jgi:GDPmannose 4,6-dehydratase